MIKPNLYGQQMEGLAKNISCCESDIWSKEEEEDVSECESEDTGWKQKRSLTYCWYLHHSYSDPDGMRGHYGANVLCIDTQMSKNTPPRLMGTNAEKTLLDPGNIAEISNEVFPHLYVTWGIRAVFQRLDLKRSSSRRFKKEGWVRCRWSSDRSPAPGNLF